MNMVQAAVVVVLLLLCTTWYWRSMVRATMLHPSAVASFYSFVRGMIMYVMATSTGSCVSAAVLAPR